MFSIPWANITLKNLDGCKPKTVASSTFFHFLFPNTSFVKSREITHKYFNGNIVQIYGGPALVLKD